MIARVNEKKVVREGTANEKGDVRIYYSLKTTILNKGDSEEHINLWARCHSPFLYF